ncbi:MAG TPA: endonuclease MutS2 [Thermoflexia bacterium]|nr:endonuclease MutS2 [Thermoflexia bacterium]
MNRHWETLEYPKILARLARHADFSAGVELALNLEPASEYREMRERLELTREARLLLEARPDFVLGGIHDIRPAVAEARRGLVLETGVLMEVWQTLLGAQRIARILKRLELQFPGLAAIAARIIPQRALTTAIDAILDKRGVVRDAASPELVRIRRKFQVAQASIQQKLERMITSSSVSRYLQEAVITRRAGRYVLPVQANYKGKVEGIVHDRSSSGVTYFMEPLAVVDLNNELRELVLAEEAEIHRLLSMLTWQVGAVGDELAATIVALAELDLILARARYAEELDATVPEIIPIPALPPRVAGANLHSQTVVRLRAARHPLLDPEEVVPVDAVLTDETHILIITGPNTGGKTVTLKTVGLLVLMAQAGMHLPVAAGSALSSFREIYVDIGDEQSIEQNLSTFSSHLTNIISFQEQADHRSLVLLDELGAGTDPAEGSALARALLEALREQRCTALVATHYPELKLYANDTPGVCNASMEFDTETLEPTYQLTIGLPGRSNAFAIARRLGLSEVVVQAAAGMLSGEALRADEMLDDLHTLRIQAAQARDEERRAQQSAEVQAAELRERLRDIEAERREILEQAAEQAALELDALRQQIRDLRRRAQLGFATSVMAKESLVELAAEVEELEAELPQPERSSLAAEISFLAESEPRRRLRVGDTVQVLSWGMEGKIISISGAEVEVQAGALRTRVALDAVSLVAREPEPSPPECITTDIPRPNSPGVELDLRGMRALEARHQLARYLDAAALTDLPWARIIHGKGTGVLRQEVRNFLAQCSLVTSYQSAPAREGGEGVTIAKLAQG